MRKLIKWPDHTKTCIRKMLYCAVPAHIQKKYYLNEDFEGLPEAIKDELKIMCVLYTEDIGGVLQLKFDDEGNLQFETSADEGDLLYDDIGSVLKIKQLQNTKSELLEALETYYRVFFLGENWEEEE